MRSPTPPDWIQVHRGTIPVLLLAPHGGRRTAARQPGHHKVNDLHTADFTDALAHRTGANTIVNRTRDRNELDLNRITQVREHASWLPALLADTLEREVARAGHATLLVIHGWNIGQPACDVGVGLVERAGALEPARTGTRTVTSGFLEATLPRLRRLAAEAGIAVTVGARYPAAHPNNLLQLVTAASRHDPDPAIRRLGLLAAADHIDAVQLELGIPLRWPGPTRDRMIDVLVRAITGLRQSASTANRPPALPTRLTRGGRPTGRRALQFVHGDTFGLTAIETDDAGAIGGRLLLSTSAETLALFTGELGDRTGPRWHVPPLRYDDDSNGWQLHYRGDLLSFGNLEPFLDLENGLADGHLMAAQVGLDFRTHIPGSVGPAASESFGDLTGQIVLGNRTVDIRTRALCINGTGSPPRGLPSLRIVAPRTPVGSLAMASTAGQEIDANEFRFALDGGAHRQSDYETLSGTAVVRLAGDRATLTGHIGTRPLAGRIERLIPIRRPGRPGTILLTIYGLCRFDRPTTSGWVELVTEHRQPVNTPEG